MQTRFHIDSTGVSVAIVLLTPGFLMMAVGFIGFNSGVKLIVALAVGTGVLIALWFALARGTHVTIDENKNLYGTLFFFRGRTTPLSDAVAISAQKAFMGAMTEVYITYRKKDGTLATRTIVSKEGLKKSDFKKLLQTIRSANPNIDIPKELLAPVEKY